MRTTLLTTIAALTLLIGSQPIEAQSGHDLFQQALVMERASGELREAIGLYERIVEEYSADRELVARALVQMGQCYERLGLTNARDVYRRVIDDFPDQRVEVATARQRLTSLSEELAELRRQPTFRKIEIASKPQNGVLSPDGERLAFVSDGAVWAVPLHGAVDPDIAGEPMRLAAVPNAWDLGSLLSWSADGRWIAVNSYDSDADEVRVYVVPANGGEPRLVDMPDHGGWGAWDLRLGLSPDGQRVAFSAVEPGSPQSSRQVLRPHVYSISTTGGEAEQLSSHWSSMPAYSTDGEHVAYVGYRERDDGQGNTERPPVDGDLWVVPSAGGTSTRLANTRGRLRGPVWSPDGRLIAAHHEPRGDSDAGEVWVFPVSLDRFSAGDPVRIGLPRSSRNIIAGWTPDNALGVFIASESHMAVYTVPASGGRAVQTTPEGYAWYPRWSGDGERIYFRALNEGPGRVSIGHSPAIGGNVSEVSVRSERPLVSRVPGGGFNISPDGEKIVFSAAEAPFDRQEGVDLWTVPLDGGDPTRLTNDASFEGYPCWSPDGQWIAFTDGFEQAEDGGVHAIYVIPAQGGEARQLTSEVDSVDGGAITYAPNGELITFFSGNAIKTIPIEGGQSEVLARDIRSGWQSQLAYAPDGSKIAHNFGGEIWLTSLDGRESEELRTGLPENARLGDFGWSPDGSRIAFIVSMGGEPEFWLISDFLP